jgi:uncharacterized membrane protein YqaE (UPF0057 family)
MIHMDKVFTHQNESVSSRVIEIMLAIIIPPVAVLLNRGVGNEVLICLVLTILGFIPGVIYAFYVILSDVRDDHLPDSTSPKS